VQWFWRLVREASPAQRRMLLAFATGSERVPANGFADLRPPIVIERRDGVGPNAYPTASTCFHQLRIPASYTSYEMLRDRMLAAASQSQFVDEPL
jgi:hypothetical protein